MNIQSKSVRTHVLVDLDVLSNELNFGIRILDQGSQTLLNTLYLLRDGTKNSFFETVELIETSPGSDLTETDKDTAHGLEVERLVTAEDQDETPKLHTKRLDRLRFAYMIVSQYERI